jgi:general secretion pathway protein G
MLIHERRVVARGGFTLLELLVVVAILVILAAAGGVIYMRHLETARKDIAKTQAKLISEAVKTYYVRNGSYPANLVVMTQPSPDGERPYLEASAILDPWSREYQYTVPGQHHPLTGDPDVFSLGPNPGDPNGIIGDWMR